MLLIRNRISHPGAVSHITQRAPGREKLFLEDADYLFMLHLLKAVSKKMSFEIWAFALMPNHVHLLICQQEDNLSKAMKNLFQKYANYLNKKYSRKGHVFCGVFRQALALRKAYALASSLYIHNNPFKARLAQSAFDYRWSSISTYFNSKKSFINSKPVLKMIHQNPSKAKITYRLLLEKSLKFKDKPIKHTDKNILQYFKTLKSTIRQERVSCSNMLKEELKADELLNEFKKHKRIREPELLAARKYLIEQMLANGYTIELISQELNTSRRNIHKIIQA